MPKDRKKPNQALTKLVRIPIVLMGQAGALSEPLARTPRYGWLGSLTSAGVLRLACKLGLEQLRKELDQAEVEEAPVPRAGVAPLPNPRRRVLEELDRRHAEEHGEE